MLQGLQKDKPIVARSPSAFLERCPHTTTVESAWPSGEEEAASALGAGSLAASCYCQILFSGSRSGGR